MADNILCWHTDRCSDYVFFCSGGSGFLPCIFESTGYVSKTMSEETKVTGIFVVPNTGD